MQKMLDHGDPKFLRSEKEPSPFLGAAGMVLSVGMTVLGGIAKAIKATTRLLIPSSKPSGKELLENIKNRQHGIGDQVTTPVLPPGPLDEHLGSRGALPTKI